MSSTFPETGRSATRVIAHRGACGYLPEHTAVAKTLAYGFGVDFLEQDLVASRDRQLLVLHDITLDDISDVAERFAARRRTDGHFYVVDFDYAELQQLELRERRKPNARTLRFPGRFAAASPAFRIMRFEDEVRLIAGLNQTTGRRVGIYPEIKNPEWHTQHGIDLTRLIYQALTSLLQEFDGPVFVQSFAAESLIRLRDEFNVDWPLVRLLDEPGAADLIRNPEFIARIARYANAVGLPYGELLQVGDQGVESAALSAQLADAGLPVHPYTLRRDDPAPAHGIPYRDALRYLIRDLQVDAIFCDQPDDALAIRNSSSP